MENNENLNFDSLTEFTYDINDMGLILPEAVPLASSRQDP